MIRFAIRFLMILLAASAVHAQSASVSINNLPSRSLSYVVGHDASGLAGREPAVDFLKPSTPSPTSGNIACWGTSANIIADCGKALPSGAIVGTTDAQALSNKTLPSPVITGGATFNGSSSGSTVLQASSTASGTMTIPTGTDTLLSANGVATVTNKSIDASQINSGTLPASRLSGSYPSVTQINSALFGNAGSNPYIGGNGNVPFSLQANGYEFLRGFDTTGSGNMRVWVKQTTDTDAVNWLNLASFGVGSQGYPNSIVGVVVNNLSPGTLAFPTGVTGAAYNKSNGNTAFGIYGEGHAVAQGIVPAAELAAFQDGAPAPTSLPFNNTIGTTQTVAKSLQLTAGSKTKVSFTGDLNSTTTINNIASVSGLIVGQLVEGSGIPWGATIASIGTNSITISSAATATSTGVSLTAVSPAGVATEIGREGGTLGVFQTAHYIDKDAVLNWSYYQDASSTQGPNSGIYMAIPGKGFNLLLKTTGSMSPTSGVLVVQDASANNTASIRQNGQAFFGNGNTSGVALTLQNTAGTCTLTPTSSTASFACSSDERLKKNIVDASSALDWIRSFRVREYDLKSTGDHLTGVIAQDVQKTHPEMVHAQANDILAVDGPNPWMMVKAIQELQTQNDDLRLELRITEMATIFLIAVMWVVFWVRTAYGKREHAL